jgi:hypothetical protein
MIPTSIDVDKRKEQLEQYSLARRPNIVSSLRRNLGDDSFKEAESILEEYQNVLEGIKAALGHMSDNEFSGVLNLIQDAYRKMDEFSRKDNPDFIRTKSSFCNDILDSFFNIKQRIVPYLFWQFFGDMRYLKNFDAEIRQKVSQLERELNEKLDEVESRANEVIKKFEEEIAELGQKRQEAARDLSVDEAINQFKVRAKELKSRVRFWGVCLIASIATFIFCIWQLWGWSPEGVKASTFNGYFSWDIVYHTTLRVLILSTIVWLIAVCLRVFRSYLHLQEHNLHRLVIAQGMKTFILAAATKEHQDIILIRLVEAVSEFGNSGLIEPAKSGGDSPITQLLGFITKGGADKITPK